MRSTTVLSFLALLVGATYSQAQYTIDPNSVPLSLRQTWCDNQITQCPLICLQLPGNSASTVSNTCNPQDLSYSCVCSNGVSPNVTEYSQTIPYYVCTEWGNQCVAACGQNNACSNDCRANHPCGAQNPVRVNTTSSATMSATQTGGNNGASTTNGAVYTGFGGAAATTTAAGGKTGAASTITYMGQSYGLVVVFAGIFAGFALVL
ncbi:hypothetical protein K432DRAFT_381769 [Lepidopterella palustris CBS 459.81]|uniref:DUF7707 domain-containing protein n=1 Tax=Lepidopterella palustris CBS 459.81 TaxID=1314670 RepID=A0A8E2EBF6_9PEZI|nr:hypothetical protein K432DRAFT_381769 [Lepidopterella palustris CBS 459.81]